VKDAIAELLAYAWHQDKQSLSAGEIEDTLKNFKVHTSRSGAQASETKSLWLLIVRVLTARQNAETFTLARSGKKVSRHDRVSLVHPPAQR
jgi:hypothetical protein